MESPVFDPTIDISPYELFRRLEDGDEPRLIDLRDPPSNQILAGSEDGRNRDLPSSGNREVVLVDRDGREARVLALRAREKGVRGIRALFGGLRLYDFALDPAVVGDERFLIRID